MNRNISYIKNPSRRLVAGRRTLKPILPLLFTDDFFLFPVSSHYFVDCAQWNFILVYGALGENMGVAIRIKFAYYDVITFKDDFFHGEVRVGTLCRGTREDSIGKCAPALG